MIQLFIIDKQPVVRAGLRAFLQQQPDMTVVAEAGSCQEALAQYHEFNPDISIIDLSLSEDEGFEFSRQICNKEKEARLLGFSAQPNPILRLRAGTAGIKGLAYKTDSADSILTAICAVANGETHFLEEHEVRKDSLFWGIHLLTPREFEVFRYLAEGHTVIEIAGILKSSPKTVGVHQTRIIKKLGVENSAQLAHLALGGGVIQLKSIALPHLSQTADSEKLTADLSSRQHNL